MAQTKQTARRLTTGRAPRLQLANGMGPQPPPLCFQLEHGKRHIPKSRYRRHSQLPKSHSQDTPSSKIIANFKHTEDFPYFIKLPYEIQIRVWEMLAEEPRIVAINTKTDNGLYSSIPPILHVCSESRAIGLRYYTLAFESEDNIYMHPPRVYFNFERDTFYLRENWNRNVTGLWCCLSQFFDLVNEGDLKRVRRVGLDVNARVCSLKTSGKQCHLANFAHWDALEILYLGYEDVRLGRDCPIGFRELESKDYKEFLQRYKINPCLGNIELSVQDVEAIEQLRNEVPIIYHGPVLEVEGSYRVWMKRRYVHKKLDGFLKKLELVSIKHL